MSRELELKVTNVFERNQNAFENDKYRYVINQGGSRSGKSIAILQLLIITAISENKRITIVRKTLASAASIIEDFFGLLFKYEIYGLGTHNKTKNTFTFSNGSVVEFLGADNDLKLRGRKRDILFCNEVNELDFEEWLQLVMRTTGKIICDFNPSETEHFIYDVLKEEDSILIKSTYKDNPFLTDYQIQYIEDLIKVDINYYKIYALGEIPTSETRIFTHFKQFVDELNIEEMSYGLDIGFNHPTALVESKFIDNKVYVKELLYESGMTSNDLINRMILMGLNKNCNIYVDSARPDIIEDLRRNGFYKAVGADKKVKEGIDMMKSLEIYIHINSNNIMREYKLYNWKIVKEVVTDEPIKLHDDALDAIRYSIYSHKIKTRKSKRSFILG